MHSKTLETYLRKSALFKNIYTNGDWVNFSCILAPYSYEHKFKDDKSPSAGITCGKDNIIYYKCFTCKHQGPFLHTVERYELKSKKQLPMIKSWLEEEEGLPDYEYLVSYNEKIKPEPLPFTNIFDPIADYPEAQRYLLNRNISLTTAKDIGLEYDPDSKRIVFPVRDRKGVVYGFTGRSIDPTSKVKIKDYHFQKSQFILGIEFWKDDQPTILVEGLFAYAHLHELKKGKYFPYNIGAIMGSAISTDQAEILNSFGRPIYCLLDGDSAGRTGQQGKKGLIHYTKDNIPTFILPYPKIVLNVMGAPITVQKYDPDTLTFDEVWSMLHKARLVI